MKIIVGLGNPDDKYVLTRHNVGFMAVDAIAESLTSPAFKKSRQFHSEISETSVNSEKILLVKPSTYMNLSGKAIQSILAYYKLNTESLIVIYDDIDLPLGQIRIKKQGSAGTHNGMKSIVELIGKEFVRVRIGIKGEETFRQNSDLAGYVLSNFSKQEQKTIAKTLELLPEITQQLLSSPPEEVMNKYNS